MTDTVHVLSTLNLTAAQLERLRAVSPRLLVEQRTANTPDHLAALITPEVEVLYTNRGDFAPSNAPNLRWAQLESAGVNHVHATPLWQSAVQITSANGVHAVQIGEYVLSVLLAHCHRLPQAHTLQLSKEWANNTQREWLRPVELRGATLGVVGYGAIGREAAQLHSAFGMHILATQRAGGSQRFNGWTPPGTGDAEGTLPERFYPFEQLHEFLAACDVVLLALPLTNSTQQIIGARELAAMRSNALLINIGRGALVDQAALVTALQEKRIGGVALDVTDPEPLPADNPLWGIEQAIITPHISGMSMHYDDRVVELFAENLRRYLASEPLLNLVNREWGY